MKNRRTTLYLDVVRHYGLDACETHEGCLAGFSRVAHYRGRYDAAGVVHSSRLRTSITKRRLGEVLVVIAGIVLDHNNQPIPLWRKIYEANIWAMREAKLTWKVQLSASTQAAARKKVVHLARITRVRLRYHHPAVYQWAHAAGAGETNGSKATRTSRVDAHARQAL